jgi:hypothetical protein
MFQLFEPPAVWQGGAFQQGPIELLTADTE